MPLRETSTILTAGIATLAVAGVFGATDARAQQVAGQSFPGYMDFEGRYLAVLSDADMVASAYLDGDLGPRSAELRDELALIPLADGLPGTPVRVAVSNAVTAWPSLLALSPDGRFAYVAETDGPAPEDASTLSDLQASPMVRVVAIADDLSAEVVQEVETAGRAIAAAMRPQGDLLAVATTRTGTPQVALVPVEADGRLGAPRLVDLPEAEGDPSDLKWNPDGTILAITMPRANAARFYRLDGDALVPHGNPVVTGKLAGVGHWAPDGRHFFVTNLHWGGDVVNAYVGSEISTLTAIRVAPIDEPEPSHVMVSTEATGASAEEFTVSPDGRTIVTLNMERSFLTPDDARLTYHSSLTLITWDAESERLIARGTFPFEGILPEGITFDASGRFLAVANFAHANPSRPIAETTVDFWRLVDGPEPLLVQTDMRLPVMRGTHVVLVQP